MSVSYEKNPSSGRTDLHRHSSDKKEIKFQQANHDLVPLIHSCRLSVNTIGKRVNRTDLTFHFGIGSNDVKDCPANFVSNTPNMKDKTTTNPNSLYSSLIQKIMTSQDAAMIQGGTIRKGSTFSKSVPFPPHCYGGISDSSTYFIKRTQ